MRRVQHEAVQEMWQQCFDRALPEKIVCVGLNYIDHAVELSLDLPSEPLLFGKFPNALVDPDQPIVLPVGVGHVDAEAELAIVIGRRVRSVAAADALDVIAGYVCANDISARELQFKDSQWLRAKGFDTFCPISTDIVPVDQVGDARGLRVVQRLNGVVLQDSSTDEMIFGVPEIVAHASTVFTLEPGDLILTGTPAGVGVFRTPKVALADGDVVEVEVERIGRSPTRSSPTDRFVYAASSSTAVMCQRPRLAQNAVEPRNAMFVGWANTIASSSRINTAGAPALSMRTI